MGTTCTSGLSECHMHMYSPLHNFNISSSVKAGWAWREDDGRERERGERERGKGRRGGGGGDTYFHAFYTVVHTILGKGIHKLSHMLQVVTPSSTDERAVIHFLRLCSALLRVLKSLLASLRAKRASTPSPIVASTIYTCELLIYAHLRLEPHPFSHPSLVCACVAIMSSC